MFAVFFRTFLLYILVIFCLRFMGKRQIGELQPSELVTTIVISNIAAIPIENLGSPLINGVVPIIMLACFEVILSAINLKSKFFRRIISGTPMMVIRNGTVDQQALRDIRFSIDDLMEQLRGSGYFNLDEIAYAIVETNGQVSVYNKFDSRPVTCGDLGIKAPQVDGLPVVIISDGIIEKRALAFCNVDQKWLDDILKKEGKSAKDIFIMTCDISRDYIIIPKEQKKSS